MKMFYIGVLSYFGIPPEQFTQVCKHVVPHSLSSTAIHNNLLTLTAPLLVDNSLILITYCQPVHISLHLYTGLQILNSYRKIPKMSPGAYIFQRPFLRGSFLEGLILGGAYLRREIDWSSLIFGGKFTVFALFYFVFEGNFPSTSPRAYIWRGDLTEGYLRYRFGGLIFGGAYTWRGLFSEFYGIH